MYGKVSISGQDFMVRVPHSMDDVPETKNRLRGLAWLGLAHWGYSTGMYVYKGIK